MAGKRYRNSIEGSGLKNTKMKKDIRVTIFEDNKSLRFSLYQLINGSDGFTCAGAFEDCLNLLRDIEDTRPDVVLMDIQMPGINGI